MSWNNGGEQLIGAAIGVSLASTTDTQISISAKKYIIRRIIVTNRSVTPVLAAGGLYTGASKTGTTLVGTGQLYTALTSAAKYLDLALASIVGTDILTASTLYFSLTVANAVASTADIYIFGSVLRP